MAALQQSLVNIMPWRAYNLPYGLVAVSKQEASRETSIATCLETAKPSKKKRKKKSDLLYTYKHFFNIWISYTYQLSTDSYSVLMVAATRTSYIIDCKPLSVLLIIN